MMKFIVLLGALLVWRLFGVHTRARYDRWLPAYQRWLMHILPRAWQTPESLFLALVVVPAVGCALLLDWVGDWLFGLVGLALNLLVLLYALGRNRHEHLLENYLAAWHGGDQQAAYHWAEQLLETPGISVDDAQSLHRQVREHWLYHNFAGLFSVLFWFALLGPAGALLVRLTDLFLHRLVHQETPQRVWRFLFFLEWAPLRLLGLTFTLVGNFVVAARQWSQDWRRSDLSSRQWLGRLALSGLGLFSGADDDNPYHTAAPEFFTEAAQQELLALRWLMTRSLVVWLVAYALIVIMG